LVELDHDRGNSSPARGDGFVRLRDVIARGAGQHERIHMANPSRNRKNQPPTGQGKHQSRYLGEPRKLGKRSDVLQAQRGHPELNLGDADEETASREGDQRNPKRPKAGR
jgi:hypothetical protein